MVKNLKENIWIAGFLTLNGLTQAEDHILEHPKKELIYSGQTSNIPNNLAKEIFDYGYDDLEIIYTTLQKSISEACDKQYCVIYKIINETSKTNS